MSPVLENFRVIAQSASMQERSGAQSPVPSTEVWREWPPRRGSVWDFDGGRPLRVHRDAARCSALAPVLNSSRRSSGSKPAFRGFAIAAAAATPLAKWFHRSVVSSLRGFIAPERELPSHVSHMSARGIADGAPVVAPEQVQRPPSDDSDGGADTPSLKLQ